MWELRMHCNLRPPDVTPDAGGSKLKSYVINEANFELFDLRWKIGEGWPRSLGQLLKPHLRLNLRNTFDGSPLRGFWARCIDEIRKYSSVYYGLQTQGRRFLLNIGGTKRLRPRARPKAVLRVGAVAPSRNGGPGVLPPEKFGKYMFKIVHFRATIVLYFSYKEGHWFCAECYV